MKSAPRALALAIATSALSACSTLQDSPVAGITQDNVSTDYKEVEIATVLLAVKAQLATAIQKIEGLKTDPDYIGNKFIQDVKLKAGKGTFTGQTETVQSDTGGVALVVPVSAYADSNVKPKITAGRVVTGTQTSKLSFSFSPTVDNNPANLAPNAQGIEVGSEISDAVVSTIESMASIQAGDGKAYSPGLAPSQLELTFAFKLARTNGGGLALQVTPPAPDLDLIANDTTGYNVANNQTGTYTLSLTLPFDTGVSSDTRRIISKVDTKTGAEVYVEEAYNDDRFEELTGIDPKTQFVETKRLGTVFVGLANSFDRSNFSTFDFSGMRSLDLPDELLEALKDSQTIELIPPEGELSADALNALKDQLGEELVIEQEQPSAPIYVPETAPEF